jgi:hypothetical protein
LREKGHTRAQIAHALGYSERSVTRLKAFFELPAILFELGATRPEKFTASLAEVLKKGIVSIGEEQTRVIFERALKENLSLRETGRLIHVEKQRLQREANLRPRRTYAQEIRLQGDKIGNLNVWEMPERQQKIQFSAILDKTRCEQLTQQLETFLQGFVEEAGAEEA